MAGGRPDPSVCRMSVPREVSETSLQLATEVHDSCGQVLKARRCKGRPWYNGQEQLTRRKEHGTGTTKTAKIGGCAEDDHGTRDRNISNGAKNTALARLRRPKSEAVERTTEV